MRTRFISLACWLSAIVITVALSRFAAYMGWTSAVELATIVLVAFDCWRIRFWRFQSGISGGPHIIVILMMFLNWPIVFAWYLGMRLKIWMRVAQLREEYRPWKMSDPTVGPTGLLQPWRGRKI